MRIAKLNLHKDKDIDKPVWKEHYRGETAPYFYSLSKINESFTRASFSSSSKQKDNR